MTPDPVLWHEVECGSFAADLPVWRALAAEAGGPILELGAGTGRVSLALAADGHEVTAVEPDPALAARLRDRATPHPGLAVAEADALTLDLHRPFALIAGAMQLIQLFDRDDRARLLRAAASHLSPGGRLALAIVESAAVAAGSPEAPLPDMREHDGWVLASRPLWVTVEDGLITVTREREAVAPSGEVTRTVHRDVLHALSREELADEAQSAGLAIASGRAVETQGEAEPTIVVLMGT